MHWTRQVIALKAQSRTLQIFDLGQRQKLKSNVMTEDVVYWKWVSPESLGMVTDTAVFHWNVYDSSAIAPIKVFDRNANLSVRPPPSELLSVSLILAYRDVKSLIIGSTRMKSGWLWSASRNARDVLLGPCSYTRKSEASVRPLRPTRQPLELFDSKVPRQTPESSPSPSGPLRAESYMWWR